MSSRSQKQESSPMTHYHTAWLKTCVLFCLLNILFSSTTSTINVHAFTPLAVDHHRQRNHPMTRTARTILSLTSETATTSSTTLPNTPPLDQSSFAGKVEQSIIGRFGDGKEEAVHRVLTSWRLLEQEYVHHEFVGSGNTENSHSHQEAHSYFPGLKVQEFWDTSNYAWCQKLAGKYKAIHDEFVSVTLDMERLQEQGTNVWAGALSDDAAAYGRGWKTLVLMNRGMWDTINVNLFPITSRIIKDMKIPAVEVFFARMDPHSAIEWHSDFTSFVLTTHLGLQIPERCRLTIGDSEVAWENGKVLLFDTSIMHKAANESDEMRYILMFRVWHPDLTDVEKQALQFIYDVLEYPDLISNDANAREQAEDTVAAAKAFPRLKKTGFGGAAVAGKSRQKQKKKKR